MKAGIKKNKANTISLVTFLIICVIPFLFLHAQDSIWCLKVVTSESKFLVSENGIYKKKINNFTALDIEGTLSPDGQYVLYVDVIDSDAEIFRRDIANQSVLKLTDNLMPDNNPVWSPDGNQIAFSSSRSGRWQVYIMDKHGNNITQITKASVGAWKPKFSLSGKLAYLRMVTKPGTEQLVELVVLIDDMEQTHSTKTRITDFAWSPNGRSLAIGELSDDGGKIHFIDLMTGDDIEINLKAEIDKRLYWHSAIYIHWRPDNSLIACQIPFVGSRTVKTDKIFGDEEIFLIAPDGQVSWLEFDEVGFQIMGWEKVSR